jgi:rhodanese-related sulfurtransferase
MIKKMLLLAAVLIGTAGLSAAEFPTITIPQLKSAIDAHAVVLFDVNGTESWQQGHIPGAVDYLANQEKLAALLPADKNALVVAYCANPHCPAYLAAATAAKKLGYTNVKHLTAGIQGWKAAGEKTETGG